MKIGSNHSELRTQARLPAPRRVEKPNPASSLREDRRRGTAPSVSRSERRRAQRVSRLETRAADKLDRSRIPAEFVAQVVGQVLGSKGNRALLASRAYAPGAGERKRTQFIREL
jgi:hypothetical protein